MKIIFALIVMLLTACRTESGPSGPDWGKLPQNPNQPSDITLIEPTTEIAPEGADITGLQYIPGMQINVADNTFSTRLAEVVAAGFKYVELKIKYSYGIHNKSNDKVSETFSSMQEQMEKAGITVWSIHLPYEDKNWTSVSSTNESIRKQSVAYILNALRLCAENFPTCKNYVLHASKSVSPSKEAISQAHKSLEELDTAAQKYGVRLCVENLVGSFCYTIDDLLAVVAPFDNVYTTFDIGHANCKGYDVVKYLEAIGTKLGTVHIHDTIYKSSNDDHRLVGDGDLATKNRSWGEVYKCMLATNRYRGVFMFEPKDDQKATEVMRRFEDIILKSYKNL